MYPYSKKDPPEVRFWARVNREAGPDACWPWIGGKTGTGYGTIMVNYKNVLAHRFSYELHSGPIPEGMHQAGDYGYIKSGGGEQLGPINEKGAVDGIQAGRIPGGNDE